MSKLELLSFLGFNDAKLSLRWDFLETNSPTVTKEIGRCIGAIVLEVPLLDPKSEYWFFLKCLGTLGVLSSKEFTCLRIRGK